MSPQIDKDLFTDRWMNFEGMVPKHFDEHVQRSVPNYLRVMEKVNFVSQFLIENGSRYLDIGCSTGRTVTEVLSANKGKHLTVDMVDASPAMVDWLKTRFPIRQNGELTFNVYSFDITQFHLLTQYDLIVASLVVQFVKREQRMAVIRNIYNGLNKGGAFLWFEKCAEDSSTATEIMNQYGEPLQGPERSLPRIRAQQGRRAAGHHAPAGLRGQPGDAD